MTREAWPRAGASGQFHSRDLFVLIAIASILFGAMRALAPTGTVEISGQDYANTAANSAWLTFLHTLPLIPLLGLGLGQSDRRRFAAAAVAVTVCVQCYFWEHSGGSTNLWLVLLDGVGGSLAFLANVWVLRLAGLRLTRPLDRQTPTHDPLAPASVPEPTET